MKYEDVVRRLSSFRLDEIGPLVESALVDLRLADYIPYHVYYRTARKISGRDLPYWNYPERVAMTLKQMGLIDDEGVGSSTRKGRWYLYRLTDEGKEAANGALRMRIRNRRDSIESLAEDLDRLTVMVLAWGLSWEGELCRYPVVPEEWSPYDRLDRVLLLHPAFFSKVVERSGESRLLRELTTGASKYSLDHTMNIYGLIFRFLSEHPEVADRLSWVFGALEEIGLAKRTLSCNTAGCREGEEEEWRTSEEVIDALLVHARHSYKDLSGVERYFMHFLSLSALVMLGPLNPSPTMRRLKRFLRASLQDTKPWPPELPRQVDAVLDELKAFVEAAMAEWRIAGKEPPLSSLDTSCGPDERPLIVLSKEEFVEMLDEALDGLATDIIKSLTNLQH